MKNDLIVLGAVLIPFSTLITAHLMLIVGLAVRPVGWRALVALVVVPLAPWWGWRARMRIRAVVWVASAAVYAVALAIALR